jgi:hypothetical protein
MNPWWGFEMMRHAFLKPWHSVKESGQFKALVNLPLEKYAAVPIGQEACSALENMMFLEEGYSRPCWKSNL